MASALAEARRARGTTSPNPPVGAVLVRDGEVVGRGFTQPPGGPHAEIIALHEAAERAAGATLYVTLEPCSFHGRTGPCTEALMRAGIAEAHVAVLDPHPRVNGAGVGYLRAHGIPVTLGEEAERAAELIEAHRKFVTTGEPFVTLYADVPVDEAPWTDAGADVTITDVPSPPLRLIGDDWRHLYAESPDLPPPGEILAEVRRRRAVSCVLVGSDRLVSAFLEAGFVDKVVAGNSAGAPAGFRAAGRQDEDSGYDVFYAEGPRHIESEG